jgi:hypothetical protein
VIELEAVKLVLEASYLLTIGFHLRIVAARVLHDLVNHEPRITTNVEVSNSELDSDAQTVNEGLILGYIVGGSKM